MGSEFAESRARSVPSVFGQYGGARIRGDLIAQGIIDTNNSDTAQTVVSISQNALSPSFMAETQGKQPTTNAP